MQAGILGSWRGSEGSDDGLSSSSASIVQSCPTLCSHSAVAVVPDPLIGMLFRQSDVGYGPVLLPFHTEERNSETVSQDARVSSLYVAHMALYACQVCCL